MSCLVIFRKEIQDCLKKDSWNSMWSILGMSSVLGARIQSIYPTYAGGSIRKDLNKIIEPRICLRSKLFHNRVRTWILRKNFLESSRLPAWQNLGVHNAVWESIPCLVYDSTPKIRETQGLPVWP